METSFEKLADNRVKLSVTLTPEEVDAAVSGAYARYATSVRIPGFRAGKAPRNVVDTHVGRERVLATALEDLVEDSYPRALTAERLRPIERPDVGALDGLEPGERYSFTAEFDVRPEFELSTTEGIRVTLPPAKSTDAEIDAQIGYERDRFATLEVVADRAVGEADFVLISFTGTIDGEPYEGNVVDKYLYELGCGQMPREFDAAMIGAKTGDVVTATFPVPETSETPEYVGKAAGFEITVHEIKAKVLPALDDEFASNAGGFETMTEMREDVRARLDENKEAGRVRQMEREARDALMERLVGEVPESLVESRTASLFEDFFETLNERGISPDQYVEATGVDPETIRADIAREAALQVKDELALEALHRAKGLEVTDHDIQGELERMAEAQQATVNEVAERLDAAGAMPLLVEGIMHRQAVRWLMDNAEVIDVEAEGAPAAGTPKKASRKAPATATKKAPNKAPKKTPEPASGAEE